MPSQLLHTLFGEDVFDAVNQRLKARFGIASSFQGIASVHRKAFTLGCQGPDIFYHSRGRRPVGLEYGTLLHRRGSGFFSARLLALSLPDLSPNKDGKEIDALGAYSLGFMTHAILDRQLHPYIVYKSTLPSPRTPDAARCHAFLERIIDVLMLKRLRGEEASNWDQEGLLAEVCQNPLPGLKELLASALVQVFPERAGKDKDLSRRIDNALLDCASFYHHTAPSRTAIKKTGSLLPNASRPIFHKRQTAYLFPEDLPDDIDFLNLKEEPWFSPSGEEREDRRSLPHIYVDALTIAADSFTGIISKYLDEGLFPFEEAAQALGNGGLSIVDEVGKPCAVLRFDPFPLLEVMEGQARLRDVRKL